MCGAFEQHNKAMHRWAEILTDWPVDVQDRFDVRPTMNAGTVDARGYRERSWSLIPGWAKAPRLAYSTFNARAETVAEKSTFRSAWRKSQRCIVPVSAYFEWPVIDGVKRCHRIAGLDGLPLLLAGLWDTWVGDDERHTFTVLTTQPVSQIDWVHHRMPLLLDADNIAEWLHGSVDQASRLLTARTERRLSAAPFIMRPGSTGDLFADC
ncbi:SOS response-associated peptidase [Litorivivens sp.]|uniref:SOS response-associated peptidase n=1 Tax=Litorivivens sp. TaxID=2020868 RepID=UPI00356A6DAA